MDTLTLLMILLLGAGSLALILYPLWQQTRAESVFQVDRAGQTLEEYQARYYALLNSIRDLMFDYEMGKVSDEDYNSLLHKTKLDAAHIRRQIDRLEELGEAAADTALDAEIENMVRRQRTAPLNGNQALLKEIDAEIEALQTLDVDDGPACLQCGKPYQPGDAFCAGCGQSLPAVEIPPAAEVTPACPDCGAPAHSDDAFCAKCGASLAVSTQPEG